jgi:uncharacterized protein (TIGR00251 family)
MDQQCWSVGQDCITLNIKVTPASSKTEILDVREGRLRLKIAAAPEDGKANTALVSFFAKTLACPKNQISIVAGEKSRLKTISLPPITRDALVKIIPSSSAYC